MYFTDILYGCHFLLDVCIIIGYYCGVESDTGFQYNTIVLMNGCTHLLKLLLTN
jgi:hypothetical protein